MNYKIKLQNAKDHVWFTSDWHLFHHNILKYDNRPFNDVYQMNQTIIANHSFLSEGDHLFYLGDLTFGKVDEVSTMLSGLKCKKYFIAGNHDKDVLHPTYLRSNFDQYFGGYCELEVDHQLIVLSHYPMFEWNKGHRGAWHLFGHTHGNDHRNPHIGVRKTMNVGCMLHDYKPVSFRYLERKFAGLDNIEHH